MRYVCNQMKWLIRKKLAPCLRMTVSPSRASSGRRENNDAGEDPDEDKREDWKLAAAVLDHILCIIFSFLFVGETVVFFCIFALGHGPNSVYNA